MTIAAATNAPVMKVPLFRLPVSSESFRGGLIVALKWNGRPQFLQDSLAGTVLVPHCGHFKLI
jgi:hypothetical protein